MKQNQNLFSTTTEALFYNLKTKPIQGMLDFDYLSQRSPSIAAIIHPGRSGFQKFFYGKNEIMIPIYPQITLATEKHPQADVFINFASFRSAFSSSQEALLQPSLRTIVIVAEGLPERQSKELIALAKKEQKMIIGPATVGGIAAGKFRIGYTGGMTENILAAKLYQAGSVGLVSKSGGMMNELFHIISRATDGVYEGIQIGGDRYPGSTLLDHVLRFEANRHITLIVVLGELGGTAEYDLVDAKKAGKISKPMVLWTAGTSASIFPWEVQFGHAGAKAGTAQESAAAKNKALQEAGIIVPSSFQELEKTIQETFKKNISVVVPMPQNRPPKNPPTVPLEVDEAIKKGLVRKQTHFTSTISSDLGEEPTYNTIPLSKLIAQNASLGDILGLLWFKRTLPAYFVQFLNQALILCADHGPAVSGAHNAIVAARAGKDVISSLCSGLLTIGPRFGGAIDDACRYFTQAYDQNVSPALFVEQMKQQGIPIPGIGHRVKSVTNPDKRVQLLVAFANKEFPSTSYLKYAQEVEKITVQKAENLILNVDGCLAALFLDAITSSQLFSSEEIEQIVAVGYMNGLFALARSIGLIGHILDQKRLNEPLYRHPADDIFYAPDNKS